MNKKLIYSLCAATLLVTSCDYNEDNFPGFDNNPVTDVVYYEGEYTGKYPAEGYFSLTQGDEETGRLLLKPLWSVCWKLPIRIAIRGLQLNLQLRWPLLFQG